MKRFLAGVSTVLLLQVALYIYSDTIWSYLLSRGDVPDFRFITPPKQLRNIFSAEALPTKEH